MSNEGFLEDLAAILEVERGELSDGFVLYRDNWNSLAIVSAIVLIDEQFGITIPGEKLRDCSSVGALCQLIQAAIGSKAAI